MAFHIAMLKKNAGRETNFIGEGFSRGMKKWPPGGGFGYWSHWLIEPARTPKNQFTACYTEVKVCVAQLCAGSFRRPWGCKGMLAPWEGAQSSWATDQQHCWQWAALLHPDVCNLSPWVFLCGFFRLCKSLRDLHSQGLLFSGSRVWSSISLQQGKAKLLFCWGDAKCWPAPHPRTGRAFLSGSAQSRSSPSCREPSWPLLPTRFKSSSCLFPSGVCPRLWGTGAAQRVDHGLKPSPAAWRMARQAGCQQHLWTGTTSVLPSAWQRTGLKSIPSLVVSRDSLMHPPGKGKSSSQIEAELWACTAGLAL